jgi:hypothetical protein
LESVRLALQHSLRKENWLHIGTSGERRSSDLVSWSDE